MAEDRQSRAIEQDYKENAGLRLAMEEEPRAKIKAEYERVIRLRRGAAVTIQTGMRGKWGRAVAKIVKCEVKLGRAMRSRGELDLIRSIALVDQLNIRTKDVKSMRQSAKELLLEVQGESFVCATLEQAIANMNDEMLTTAIELAESTGMTYLPALEVARQALLRVNRSRAVLGTMKTLLDKCTTVPSLLSNYNQLQDLIVQATHMGLGLCGVCGVLGRSMVCVVYCLFLFETKVK